MSTTNMIKNEHMFSVSNALLSLIYKMHARPLIYFSYNYYLFFIIAIKSYLTDVLFFKTALTCVT